ncbi:hypothetical protein RG608_04055 [Streptococcus sp. IsoGale022]|uniref:hypothetical protein n=1 Tax=Streptococcus sp. IsoGale022 TaxID=2923524 RepID=UPI00280EA43C|nr:hypothetical protein [Streptococcus sp. IsoGale022]MDQ8692329.1 hypothetical protein [Streptococcus sp. IsoGale022]
MIDIKQSKKFQRMVLVVAAVILFLIGYGIGGRNKTVDTSGKTKMTTSQKEQTVTNQKGELSQKQVKEFLVAYFTKKDLEENRERYRPFMTKGLYTSEVNQEDKAVNQAYKGYVVDYVFQSAQIYIDQENLTAIAQVRYSNTLLNKKNNYDKAQTNVGNETTLKLTYSKQNGKFLLNNKEQMLLTSNTGTSSSYPDYGSLKEDSESSSSSSEETSESSNKQE